VTKGDQVSRPMLWTAGRTVIPLHRRWAADPLRGEQNP
jgi:hypothetical protein